MKQKKLSKGAIMNKKMIFLCLFTFVFGGVGGAALAYENHQKGLEAQSLLASISQTQDNWEVEQFIREQEEQRPEGMEESQIATGSKYNGITYNNVIVATVGDTNQVAAQQKSKTDNNEAKDVVEQNVVGANANGNIEKVMGRVAIQNGSLNIRSTNSIDDNVIGQAYKDEMLEIIQQDGVWYQIITADGVQGYVSSTYVEIVE